MPGACWRVPDAAPGRFIVVFCRPGRHACMPPPRRDPACPGASRWPVLSHSVSSCLMRRAACPCACRRTTHGGRGLPRAGPPCEKAPCTSTGIRCSAP
nr:hypothetical protein RVX_2032 [Nitratidesulfovibrio sp. HK-II]